MRSDTGQRSSWRHVWLAVAIAVLGVVVGLVWSGFIVVDETGAIDDLPRAEVPGQVTVQVDEPGVQTVYYERRTFTATRPLDPQIELEVSDPDGEPVAVEPYETVVTYRLWRLVGQAHATFEATTTGEHTIRVDGDAPEDASIAVGTETPSALLSRFIAPGLVVLGALVAAAAVALSGRDRQPPRTARTPAANERVETP